MPAKRLIIHGKVQGVFYRGWAIETAQRLGLTGWVRNQMDGTVEAVVAGDAATIEQFVERARSGPSAALVSGIDVTDTDEGGFIVFEQRPTGGNR